MLYHLLFWRRKVLHGNERVLFPASRLFPWNTHIMRALGHWLHFWRVVNSSLLTCPTAPYLVPPSSLLRALCATKMPVPSSRSGWPCWKGQEAAGTLSRGPSVGICGEVERVAEACGCGWPPQICGMTVPDMEDAGADPWKSAWPLCLACQPNWQEILTLCLTLH